MIDRRFAPFFAFVVLALLGFAIPAHAEPPPCPPGVNCHIGDNCVYSNINPLCGGTAEINGVVYSFGGLCNKAIVPQINLLGSPSGLAYNNGGGLRLKLFRSGGSRLDTGREVWLQVGEGAKPDLLDCGPTKLQCNNGQGAVVHYLEAFEQPDTLADVIYPSFGGHGTIDIAIEICCPPFYCPVMAAAFEGVSTDIDDDGDTDEDDEAILRTSMAGAFDARCDLNWDSVVDQTDLDILMLEARRRVRGTGCELDLGGFAQVRPAAISNLTAVRTGTNAVQLQWTATGDDSLAGTAFQYDVRASSSPIDAGNFASATPVTGVPAPAASGSIQSFSATVDTAHCYLALKVMDDAGNWSALSNLPPCATLAVPKPEITGLDFSLLSVDAGAANLVFSYECPKSLVGSPLELVLLDVAGRRLASTGALTANLGQHQIQLHSSAGSLRAGVYLARLRVGEKTMTRTISVTP